MAGLVEGSVAGPAMGAEIGAMASVVARPVAGVASEVTGFLARKGEGLWARESGRANRARGTSTLLANGGPVASFPMDVTTTMQLPAVQRC